jgi:hypothetical protein
MLCFFLSCGIDYRTKSPKTCFEKITSWIYDYPSAHCAVLTLFFGDQNRKNRKLRSWENRKIETIFEENRKI